MFKEYRIREALASLYALYIRVLEEFTHARSMFRISFQHPHEKIPGVGIEPSSERLPGLITVRGRVQYCSEFVK